MISVQRVVEGGRTRLVARPRRWQEFFTEEELEEMRQPGYFDEVEERARRSTAER